MPEGGGIITYFDYSNLILVIRSLVILLKRFVFPTDDTGVRKCMKHVLC